VCGTPARAKAGWRFHIGVAVFNHLHLLVSWREFVSAGRTKAMFHRAMTVAMRDARGAGNGRPWLSRGGSVKRIETRRHFDHLLKTYLPSHQKYGGKVLIP